MVIIFTLESRTQKSLSSKTCNHATFKVAKCTEYTAAWVGAIQPWHREGMSNNVVWCDPIFSRLFRGTHLSWEVFIHYKNIWKVEKTAYYFLGSDLKGCCHHFLWGKHCALFWANSSQWVAGKATWWILLSNSNNFSPRHRIGEEAAAQLPFSGAGEHLRHQHIKVHPILPLTTKWRHTLLDICVDNITP